VCWAGSVRQTFPVEFHWFDWIGDHWNVTHTQHAVGTKGLRLGLADITDLDYLALRRLQWYLGRVYLRSALAGTLSTAHVNFKSALDHSLTLLLRQRSRKNKMATLKEHTSVLAAILSDISDGSDTNFYRVTRMNSADYAVARCLSVRPHISPLHAGIESKRLYISSNCSYHQLAPPF